MGLLGVRDQYWYSSEQQEAYPNWIVTKMISSLETTTSIQCWAQDGIYLRDSASIAEQTKQAEIITTRLIAQTIHDRQPPISVGGQ
jgi:hypothetical protein